METQLRRADLAELASMLQTQETRKTDLITPAVNLTSVDGIIQVSGSEPVITESGVDTVDGAYKPMPQFLRGLASKLDVPTGYLRRLHADRTDLFDQTVNGFIHGGDGYGPDGRKFMFRAFSGDEGAGLARALLSDSYAIIDNLDILMTTLEGVTAAGVQAQVAECDLSERQMRVKVTSDEVRALAPNLLRGYVSPFSGARGDENPTVFAGFVVSNSETGGGAFSITPEITVEVCNNGMTLTKQAMRNVHLGGKQDAGVIRWSGDTNQKTLDLVKAKTRDAVQAFLDPAFVEAQVRLLEAEAGKPVEDAAGTVERVAKQMAYSKDEQAGILDMFIKGGQLTAGGVMQAVTAFSQTVDDADSAASLQSSATRVMALV